MYINVCVRERERKREKKAKLNLLYTVYVYVTWLRNFAAKVSATCTCFS